MYCVEWNTLYASPAKKSLEESNPATGRNVKPVLSVNNFKFITERPKSYVTVLIIKLCLSTFTYK